MATVLSYTFTRPANTTAYTAKDVVINATSAPTPISFPLAGRAQGVAGSGYVVGVRVATDQEANVAQFRAHFYKAAPAGGWPADNAPYGLIYADNANYLGYVDVGPLSAEDTGAGDQADDENDAARLVYECALGSDTLYVVLETLTAFTPASGQGFYVAVALEQD